MVQSQPTKVGRSAKLVVELIENNKNKNKIKKVTKQSQQPEVDIDRNV